MRKNRLILGALAVAIFLLVVWMNRATEPPTRQDDAETVHGEAKLTSAGRKPPVKDAAAHAAAAEALLARLANAAPEELAGLLSMSRAGVVPYHRGLIEKLVELLGSDDGALRLAAAGYLRMMDPRAAPHVVPLLSDERAAVRLQVLYLFHNWGSNAEAIPAGDFVRLLGDAAPNVANMALNVVMIGVPYEATLAEMLRSAVVRPPGPPAPPPDLPEGVQYSSSGAVLSNYMAAQALAKMGPEGVEILRGLLGSEDETLRAMLLRALARAPAADLEQVLPDLDEALIDPAPEVRSAALLVLLGMEGACTRCLPHLLELMEDEDADLVGLSMRILAQMGPAAEGAVPALLEHLGSPDEYLVDQAALALGAIRSRPEVALPALSALLIEEGSDTAARAISGFGTDGYALALEILRSDDPDAQYAALLVFALQGEAAAGVVPELLPFITGDDVQNRWRAIQTAQAIGPAAAAAVPTLISEMLKGGERGNAHFIGHALRGIGPAGTDALRAVLRDGKRAHRLQGLSALHAFQGETAFAIREIEPLLDESDGDLRRAAVNTLILGLQSLAGVPVAKAKEEDMRRLRTVAREEIARELELVDVPGRIKVRDPRQLRALLEFLEREGAK